MAHQLQREQLALNGLKSDLELILLKQAFDLEFALAAHRTIPTQLNTGFCAIDK